MGPCGPRGTFQDPVGRPTSTTVSPGGFERAEDVDPIGFKIGLELIVKCRCTDIREVPIQFAQRNAGESKLSLAEQLKYLRHVGRLHAHRFRKRGSRP